MTSPRNGQSYVKLYRNDGSNGFGSVDNVFYFDSGTSPRLAAGDLNGDNKLDVVMTQQTAGPSYAGTRLFLNTHGEAGSPSSGLTDTTGKGIEGTQGPRGTKDVAMADFNGDGFLDVILTHIEAVGTVGFPAGDSASILINQGMHSETGVWQGLLQDVQAFQGSAVAPYACLAFGDIDGDGDIDLYFGVHFFEDHVFLNDGSATFTVTPSGVLSGATEMSKAAVFGDLDGDGDLDAIITGNFDSAPRVLYNDGTGVFSSDQSNTIVANTEGGRHVALIDHDGDGDLDVVIQGPKLGGYLIANTDDTDRTGDMSLFMNLGSGVPVLVAGSDIATNRFNGRSISSAFGDVDNDGAVDLFIDNTLYMNDGTGQFTYAGLAFAIEGGLGSSLNAFVTGLNVVDVNGDGFLDVFFSTANVNSVQYVHLYMNDGAGGFSAADPSLTSAINSDITTAKQAVNLLYYYSYAYVLGDIDGDGDIDYLFSNMCMQTSCSLFRNDGSGTFVKDGSFALSNKVRIFLVDVDNDSDLDIIALDTATTPMHYGAGHLSATRGAMDWFSCLQLYKNDGSGAFTGPTSDAFTQTTLSYTPEDLAGYNVLPWDSDPAFADFDGDGHVDLLWYNFHGGIMFRNDGTGSFTNLADPPLAAYTGAFNELVELSARLTAGDIDGDGDYDLILALGGQNYGRSNYLYMNDRQAGFTAIGDELSRIRDRTRSSAMADIDNGASLRAAPSHDCAHTARPDAIADRALTGLGCSCLIRCFDARRRW